MVRMTSATTPKPYVVDQSTQLDTDNVAAWRAFDGDVNHGWISDPDGPPQWIQLDWGPGGERVLRSYTMYCSPLNFFPERYPASWKIEGTNDLTHFHLLDTRSGLTLAAWLAIPRRTYLYTLNPGAFRYTRLTVLTNLGDPDGYVAISDWTVSALGNANRLY